MEEIQKSLQLQLSETEKEMQEARNLHTAMTTKKDQVISALTADLQQATLQFNGSSIELISLKKEIEELEACKVKLLSQSHNVEVTFSFKEQ